jgi:DNA-directed RNA polymerase specialized sigma24 family protein
MRWRPSRNVRPYSIAGAEDAVQEASLHALLHIRRLRKRDRFGAWLAGIALNVCRGWLRERARKSWSWDAILGGQRVPGAVDWQPDPEELQSRPI